ncbi:AMP-binding protein [Flavobacterium sp. DGU11]|uniref:AMP-binding protein n=1 Tax=Flavobacterium arundinis TaxID=3139143 RepID=A0ABU9HYX8_9FLAO
MGIVSKIQVLGVGQILRTIASVYRHGFTLLALLDSVKHKKEGACKDDDEEVSYNELYRQSLAMAYHLNKKYNIGTDSKVAIVSVNSLSFVRSLFAASGLGADIFLLNPNQKKDYFDNFMASHKFGLIICDTAIAGEFRSYGIAVFCHDETTDISGRSGFGCIAKRKGGNIVILSSGSKGIPKLERRKASAINYLDPLIDIIEKLHLKETRSVLISVPIFHGYGLAALFLSVFMGKKIRLTKKFDTEKACKIIKEEKTDCWIAVPIMIKKVYTSADASLQSLTTIISGGDVLPLNIIEAFHNTTSSKLYNLYGTSETGVCTIATDNDLKKYPDTIGKAITGIKMKILEIDGSPVKNGTGRLSVKCAWSSDNRDNGYVPTGDLVYKNEDGYYFYKGRHDDMMVIGGENVYPIELENIIYKNTEIKWAKAKSAIDENGINKIQVDLVLNRGVVFCEKQFIGWISNKVPSYMIPKSVTLLDEEPTAKLMQ